MLHAVKIVTFLTMPVEAGSRDYASQVSWLLHYAQWRVLVCCLIGDAHFARRADSLAEIILSLAFRHAMLQSCRSPQRESLHLQLDVMLDVKDAFLAQDALVVVVSLVAQPLTRHAEGLMTERDTLIVQLVITFLRNLIVIPDSASRSGIGRSSLHCC